MSENKTGAWLVIGDKKVAHLPLRTAEENQKLLDDLCNQHNLRVDEELKVRKNPQLVDEKSKKH